MAGRTVRHLSSDPDLSRQAAMCLTYLQTGDKVAAVRAAYKVPRSDREAKMYAALYFESPRVQAFLDEVGIPQADILDRLLLLESQPDKLLRALTMIGAITMLGKSPAERTELIHRMEETLSEVTA